ncbi:hypothetical protein [Aquimarina sp. 2201CG14-23]|uniref:hypothetical protein n=1 Tax=Aquimarina mycalae TaxID=3040073 RepID=UPI002477E9AA|nr:hypothetical protein [Aquimarina sp. 2201CG14-23]MDH7446929.1 hypothetical protein [Aquimarina sp. 2201CG14-23]
MIQKKILLLIVLVGFLSFSQDDTGTSGEEKDVNLFSFPVSPEAGRLGTYGNVPVNLSTGQVNFQVPLHTIDARGYSWPISLSYNFKGLIYEDKPSLTGLGWLLNAGGVVTREVRGIPDEHPNGYYGINNVNGTYLNPYFSNGSISKETTQQLISGDIDGEADKYYVSVNGISFSFKVGLDKQPVFISEHNYQLQFEWKNEYELDGFIVTDDNGIKYFFSEKEYNSPTNIGSNFNVFNDSFTGYVSSWNLKRVVFPNNEEINFQYQERNYYSSDFFASGSKSSDEFNCGTQFISDTKYNEGYSKTLIRRKILTSITSSTARLSFELPFTQGIETEGYRITYSAIYINDTYTNQMLWNYGFSYQGARDLLMSIDRNGENYYSFDYSNKTGVPGFVDSENDNPFKQDLWGFYNGVNNQHGVTIPQSTYETDKRPNFSYASVGALTKITYPTGGYTQIAYEGNTVKDTYQNILEESQNFASNWQIHLQFESDQQTNTSYKEEKYQYTFNDTVVADIKYLIKALPASRSGVSMLKLNGCAGNTNSASDLGEYASHLRAITDDPIPSFCPRVYKVIDDGDIDGAYHDPVTKRGNTRGKIKIEPGTYEFKIWTNSNYEEVTGEIKVRFYLPPNSNTTDTEVPLYDNKQVGGIRISKLINYTSEGTVADTKNYEYTDEDGFSSGEELQKAIQTYSHDIEYCCCVPSTTTNGTVSCGLSLFSRKNYSSKTYNSLNLNQGVPVIYTKVREFSKKAVKTSLIGMPDCNTPGCLVPIGTTGGVLTYIGSGDPYGSNNSSVDTYYYPNGYTESSFGYDPIDQIHYPVVPKGVDKDKGRLLNQSIYRYVENGFTTEKLSEQTNNYLGIGLLAQQDSFDQNPNHPTSVKVAYRIKKEGDCYQYPAEYNLFNYFKFVKYREKDWSYLPNQTISKQYFPQEVVNIQNFTYDEKYQRKKSITTDSENHTIEVESFYPYDVASGGAAELTERNILTPVISTIIKKDGETINQSKLDYTEVQTPNRYYEKIFKPIKKLIAIGDEPLRGIVKYDQYDTYGNLLQYFKIIKDGTSSTSPNTNPIPDEGGVITSAIWGYDYKYPVAQILNASYDEAISHLSVSIDELQNLDGEQLRIELDNIRQALPDAQVTTHTYKPLVGVTSITDPRGYTIFYEYDELYRLQFARDHDGNILTENQYNYRD